MRYHYMRLCIIVVFTLFAGVACEGPAGSDGAQGEQGFDGAQGEQGPPGTANVIYSDWMNFDWNIIDDNTTKQMYIEESRVIEEDFIENGTLLAYLKAESPEGVNMTSLPYTNGTDVLYFAIADVPAEDIEGIVIALSATDGTTSVQSDWSDYQVRYVMIPGGVPAKRGPGFLNDYHAVANYYSFEP